MADYYVDFSSATNPGSAGTQADPFGWAEFVTGINTPVVPNNWYARGTRVLTADTTLGLLTQTQILYAWDVDLYGPWRIYGNGLYDIDFFTRRTTINDGIISCEVVAIYGANRVHVDLNDVNSQIGTNCTQCTFVYRTAFDIGSLAGATVHDRCVWNAVNGDAVNSSGGAGGATVSNSVMTAASFLAFDNNNVNVIDGGGNLYSKGMWEPAYNADEDLFDLAPNCGVGYDTNWASHVLYYVNVDTSYDAADTHAGTQAYPLTWEDLYTFIMNNGSATAPLMKTGTIYRVTGLRTITADIYWIFKVAGQELDGWDGNTGSYVPDKWGLVSAGTGFTIDWWNGVGGSRNNLSFSRYTFDSQDLAFTNFAGQTGPTTFRNSYFYNATQIQLGSFAQITVAVDGCTFNTPELAAPGAAFTDPMTITFRHCLFNETILDIDDPNITIVFDRCTFVGKSHAQIVSQVDAGSVTFSGCTYSAVLLNDLPAALSDVTEQNLTFSMFGLPLIDASFSGYDFGFSEDSRDGVGAFWFTVPSAVASASPSSGVAPLTVQFTGTDHYAISSHYWDFGDGASSGEESPSHLFESPGEYEVTYTVTDAIGNTSSTTITVYVYNWDYGAGYVVSKTDKCFRHAVPQQPAQGVGWSFYTGEGWPFPIGKVGTLEITSPLDERIPLVMDSTTFKIHELGRDDQWKDAEDEYTGYEISSEVLYPELYAKSGSDIYRHSESHVNTKPWFKDQRSTGEFDANGYRPGFSVDVGLRQDSLPTDTAVARGVPENGQIVVDRHFESKFIQMLVRLYVAPWRLVLSQMWAKVFYKGAAPPKKLMSEMTWALQWSTPLLWIGRDEINPVMERVSGETLSGSYGNTTAGPDGKSGSGVVMGAADSLTATAPSMGDSGFGISVWLRSTGDSLTLYNDGTLRIRVISNDDGHSLRFEDGDNDLRVYLSSDYVDWTQLAIVRDAGTLEVYENGSLTNTVGLSDNDNEYGGSATLLSGGCQFSDMRIVSGAPSLESVLYMYRDMTEHSGDSTCPVW